MRYLTGSARILAASAALLGGLLVGPAVLGQAASTSTSRPTAVIPQEQVFQRMPTPPPEPPRPQAIFSLQAPAAVEAGRPFRLTIARVSSDGQQHDFVLQFDPTSLVNDPQRAIAVPDGRNGSVTVTTIADPPGDGPHRLRVLLIPGRSKPDIRVRTVEITVNEPPPPPASFSLRAPATVEAGESIPITIVRDRNDGRAHDFRLQFDPAGIVASSPSRITVPAGGNGTVRIATRADPPGDGRHRLRIVLVAGDSGPRIGAPRFVDVTVNEPPPPAASFSLRAPATVEAGEAIPITIVRDRNDGRAHDFRLQFEPAGIVANPPGRITVPAGGNGTVRVATRADPPGDGRHALRILLVAGDSEPRIGAPRFVDVTVNEPLPASFSLRAPATVEAGEAIPITIVRDRDDGRPHDFRLQFEPASLVAGSPGRITVPAGGNGTVRVATRADPPGDGRHPLRVVLVAGDSGPRIGTPRTVTVGVDEPPPSRFSLRVPDEVQAGERIPIEIVRAGNDGRNHDLQLSYEPAGLVEAPPLRATVRNVDEGWRGEVATIADPPGDEPHVLQIVLGQGQSRASVIVTEPLPAPTTSAPVGGPTYAVQRPAGEVRRGDELVFSVTRRGGSGLTRVPYDAFQSGRRVASGDLVFEGDGAQTITLSSYDVCLEGPWLELRGVPGELRAQAQLSPGLPPQCPDARSFWAKWWPWWALPSLLPLGWAVARLFRRGRDAPEEGDTAGAPAELRSEYALGFGESAMPDGEPELRGPAIAIHFHTTFGAGDCPDPLPLRETADV